MPVVVGRLGVRWAVRDAAVGFPAKLARQEFFNRPTAPRAGPVVVAKCFDGNPLVTNLGGMARHLLSGRTQSVRAANEDGGGGRSYETSFISSAIRGDHRSRRADIPDEN